MATMVESSSSDIPAPRAQPEPVEGAPRYPTMVHFIMASVMLTPLALLPYIPIRRRLVRLSRQLESCSQGVATLRRDMVDAGHGDDILRLKSEIDVLKREVSATRQQLGASSKELATTRDALAASNARHDGAAHGMLADIAQLRARTEIPSDVLGSMGDSFAAMAHFVEEMELKHGLNPRAGWDRDPRGIVAMRQTALRLKAIRGAATNPSRAGPASPPRPEK